jgi:translation initiation factor IF-3
MDFGKYKYEQTQKAKRAKKHASTIVIKEIKLRPKIERHDFDTKKKHVRRFLNAGAKVKVTIMFRGREMTHTELGLKLLERLQEEVSDLGELESKPKLDGRNMVMVLAPLPSVAAVAKENRRGETNA